MEGDQKRGVRRTGFAIAVIPLDSNLKTAIGLFGESAGNEAQERANALFFALATRLDEPTPPRRCGVADGVLCAIRLLTSRFLGDYRYRCGVLALALHFVLVVWQDRRNVRDTVLTAGRGIQSDE